MSIYQNINHLYSANQKGFAVLIDPDKWRLKNLDKLFVRGIDRYIDFIFVGGSLLVESQIEQVLKFVRARTEKPVILFPGDSFQLSNHADAVLFLSLISGRNPELLIGKHVIAAPVLQRSSLEVIPTGYMLIDGGVPTSVSYMSNTNPIPHNKWDIAQCTALAGQMLGLKLIYMDAGSGAEISISQEMIAAVCKPLSIPLIVGGGIRSPDQARRIAEAGADLVVVGSAIEEDPGLAIEISEAIKLCSSKLVKSG